MASWKIPRFCNSYFLRTSSKVCSFILFFFCGFLLLSALLFCYFLGLLVLVSNKQNPTPKNKLKHKARNEPATPAPNKKDNLHNTTNKFFCFMIFHDGNTSFWTSEILFKTMSSWKSVGFGGSDLDSNRSVKPEQEGEKWCVSFKESAPWTVEMFLNLFRLGKKLWKKQKTVFSKLDYQCAKKVASLLRCFSETVFHLKKNTPSKSCR